MKIGYPCINLSVGCKSDSTFRLKSYSEERLTKTVENNLDCLLKILKFNVAHKILFFRITSDLIPFASHKICTFDWQGYFKKQLREIGRFITDQNIRISMHPDQFTLINSPIERVFENSQRELLYHTQVLDLMQLDSSAKIQIHVGGVYADRQESIQRFISRYKLLDTAIRKRMVIENDDRLYGWGDCLKISHATGIPILLDIFHHSINNKGEGIADIFKDLLTVWKEQDGLPMIDYSHQESNGKKGKHAESIDVQQFKQFLALSADYNLDIMLEIKDKEKSALKAISLAQQDLRFFTAQSIS